MMYKHSLFFEMIADAEDAEVWVQNNREDAEYGSCSNDGETGLIEYCFYTPNKLPYPEQRSLVRAISPNSYAFNGED